MALSSGSDALDRMVEKLAGTPDPKRRYEYVLWLAETEALPLPDLDALVAATLSS